ncbi:MAG TPA: hypothetical protein VEO73_02830, partial [Gemmatimonadales bacterium]|nr:hypothetical protein [Gemmatimonadales bacterium]
MQTMASPNGSRIARLAIAAALVVSLTACSTKSGAGAGVTTTPPPTGIDGTWYLMAGSARLEMRIDFDALGSSFTGQVLTEGDAAATADVVDQIVWDPGSGALQFRRSGPGFWEWYRACVVEGVLVGRYARSESAAEPGPEAYQGHVTGWSEAYFDRDLFPRVYELRLNDGRLARLRIDRAGAGDGFAGRLKVYAIENAGTGGEGSGEDLEYDVAVAQWDGTQLVFTQPDAQQTYVAQVSGRFIEGTIVQRGNEGVGSFSGTRAEVLTHGLADMAPSARDDWQRRTRLQLAHLMMAGDPPPTSVAVTPLGSATPPFVTDSLPPDRDDDPANWPQHYQLTELQFDVALPGPEGGSLLRRAHGFLAKPTDPPPPGGYPVVVALNGHDSSARGTFDPGDEYYFYGDAWARHGYAVLALDISHRPLEDRSDLYDDYELGDDPEAGNGPHPAIKSPGFDTDWEENGERVWDVMRGIDYVRTLPDVNGSQIIVTGLSMGGEVASFVGALDPRVPVTVVAGFSPDLGVMLHNGSHP